MVSYEVAESDYNKGHVLILIVMDNGLLPGAPLPERSNFSVLILIVMDNGLLPAKKKAEADFIVLILIVMDNGLLP